MTTAVTALVAGSACSGTRAKPRSPFQVFTPAAGATRLHRSPSGRWWVAERRERWGELASGLGDFARPGLVKLLSLEGDVNAVVRGFAMGGADDQGRFLWVQEHEDEYAYHVHASDPGSLALDPPAEGFWFFQSAHHDPRTGCAVVVLEQPVVRGQGHRERVWIASVDPVKLTVKATTILDAALPHDRRTGVDDVPTAIGGITAVGGTTPGAGVFTLASMSLEDSPDGAFTLTSLSCETLKPLWTAQVPEGKNAGGRSSVQERIWENRVFRGLRLTFTGTGRHLAVVYGRTTLGTLSPEVVSFFDAVSGQVKRVASSSSLISSYCTQLVPVHEQDAVLALALPRVRNMGNFDDTFFGVYEYALTGSAVRLVVDGAHSSGPSPRRHRGPEPFAIGSFGGKVVLAPLSARTFSDDEARWRPRVKRWGPTNHLSRARVQAAASWFATLPRKE